MITHIITVSKDKEFKRYFTQKFDQKQQKQQKNNTIYTTTVKIPKHKVTNIIKINQQHNSFKQY